MPDLPGRLAQHMLEAGMPSPQTPLLVAVSGGADSVALACLLQAAGYPVHIVHCNHGLRPEADEEEAFVADLAVRLGTPYNVYRFSEADFERRAGEGLQQAARKLRYAAFEQCMATHGLGFCATAHHADDQLETLVLSFFRGAGPRLFKPIPAMRPPYLRPLLPFHKSELVDWLRSAGISWRHDASNDRNDYRRNLVRNALLPLLEELDPGFAERFSRQAARQSAQWDFIARLLAGRQDAFVVAHGPLDQELDFAGVESAFGRGHLPVVLDWWLAELGFGGVQLRELQRLAQAQAGGSFLAGDRRVLRTPVGLRVMPADAAAAWGGIEVPLQPDLDLQVETGFLAVRITITTVADFAARHEGGEEHWLDADRVEGGLRLRPWQQGDRMQPLGMRGTKLLSDILGEQKRDATARARALVLCDEAGILLLMGYRIAGRAAISDTTRRCLRVSVSGPRG